jgi:hypothetical protein
MRDIARQLRTDFGHLPDLVDEYTVHTPWDEALRASRQVCGVSHYLSLMTTGEVDMRKCAAFGVTITCIDEVTDELNESLHPEVIRSALRGDPAYEPLRVLPEISDLAASDRFDNAITQIGKAQDMSMEQFGDITKDATVHITRKKGGWSARANLAMFKPDIPPHEWNIIRDFGYLMQMLDDYLDRPKDKHNGLTTPYAFPQYNSEWLKQRIDTVERDTAALWGKSRAHSRFFNICRAHRILGKIENGTPLSASWFAPGYL